MFDYKINSKHGLIIFDFVRHLLEKIISLIDIKEYINNFIKNNYLIVSGEHRVHLNAKFCCTTHLFQAFGYPSLLHYMVGSIFILVFRRECVPNTAVYFKAYQSERNLIGSFFLSTCTTLHPLFGFLSVPCVHCCGFENMALLRDRLLSVIGYFFASSTSANKH